MQLISFDSLRTWDIPNLQRVKPEAWQSALAQIRSADWLLFPEYWQVNFLVHALHKRIFPSVSSYYLGYSKAEMTYAFQAVCPAHVPETWVVPRTESATSDVLDAFSLPFVAKEVRSARGQGVHLIETQADWHRYAAANSVLYVQEYLPLTRDLRVVVVGREVVAAYWRIAPPGGFHNNVARGGMIAFEGVPETAVSLVQNVAAELNLDHAGFDVAVVDDYPYLLEFNMRFGNEALRQQGIKLGPHILAYLRSQMEAAPPPPPATPASTAIPTSSVQALPPT